MTTERTAEEERDIGIAAAIVELSNKLDAAEARSVATRVETQALLVEAAAEVDAIAARLRARAGVP